ncbi:hypothetical protein CsSME_00042598 [Camellia sinensis var. sinensis]
MGSSWVRCQSRGHHGPPPHLPWRRSSTEGSNRRNTQPPQRSSRFDLQTLKQLQSDLERATVDSLTSRCDLLQSYYKALCAVESRFPISGDKDHVNTVTFTWHVMFNVGDVDDV